MFKLVDTIQTSYTQKELCKAVVEAWKELFENIPIKASVGIVLSQHSIECGDKYFWNNNWGNAKVGVDDPNKTIEYIMLKNTWEIENGKKVVYQPPSRQTWFRSFPTLKDGVKFHLQLLKTGRYASSWAAIEAGDVAMFANLLKQHGYFTAPVQNYINGMNRFFLPFMRSLDYENTLDQINTAPPLEPWVEINPEPGPTEDLTILPEPSPPLVINNENVFDKVKNVFNSVLLWLKSNL